MPSRKEQIINACMEAETFLTKNQCNAIADNVPSDIPYDDEGQEFIYAMVLGFTTAMTHICRLRRCVM